MPEGDSLARIAAKLGPALAGQVVRRLRFPRKELSDPGVDGARVTWVRAQGKHLLIAFDVERVLHVHLRMLGTVRLGPIGRSTTEPGSRTSVLLETDGHRLDVLGAPVVRLIRTPDLDRDPVLGRLGPDVLDEAFDLNAAIARLRSHDAVQLGIAILDQRLVAGLGNVWKSEMLHRAGLDPFAPVSAFDDGELSVLLRETRRRMQANVAPVRPAMLAGPRFGRSTRLVGEKGSGPLAVYERAGQPCFACGTTIVRTLQGTMRRSTYHCPTCQPSRPVDPR